MQALTLADVRTSLWDKASGVPQATATGAQIAAVDSVINQVTERFLGSGKWRGSIVRTLLPVLNDRQVTLPDSLGTILGCRPYAGSTGCWNQAFSIYNQWYDFTPSTPWFGCNTRGLKAMGQGWPVFQDAPTSPFYVKVLADLDESGTNPTILLRGLDENANVIYQTDGTEGVSVSITNASPQQTTQKFNLLSYWVKSGPTNGQVRLHSVDVTTGLETPMVIITPGKRVSGYRRYAMPGSCNGDVVEAICKRAYVPAIADNDQVFPSNIGAIKLGMMSLQFEDKVDADNADKYMARALALLDADQQEFDGDSQVPSFQMSPGYGAGDICNVM